MINEFHDNPDGDLSAWEKRCLEDLEKDILVEERNQVENDRVPTNLYPTFQNLANSISHLYKSTQPTVISLWIPFQQAAGNATLLYKEGTDGLKRNYEMGQQVGSLRKTKDLVAWAKKRRRTIPREELISFLSGKPLRHRHPTTRANRHEPRYNNEANLQFFRDAMALQNQGNVRRSPSRIMSDERFVVEASSRKRLPLDRIESPNSKRQKISCMETDEYQ